MNKNLTFDNSLSVHSGWHNLIQQYINEHSIDNEINDILRFNNDNRIHLHDLRNNLLHLIDVSGDLLLPIKCAQNVSPLTFGSFSLTLWTSPTLDIALQHAQDFSIAISSPIRIQYHNDKQGNAELWILDSEPFNTESHVTYWGVALFIATLIKMLYCIVSNKNMEIDVKLVDYEYTAQLIDEIEKITKTKITKGSPVRKLCIPKKFLHDSLPNHDNDIYFASLNLLRHHSESLKRKDIILQIYNTLNKLNNLSEANAELISSSLNLNVRTLNRKLADINTSYRGVLEKYKLEKALYLLKTPNINMTEVAYQLGFSDLSAFSRAFKRWTGHSPMNIKVT